MTAREGTKKPEAHALSTNLKMSSDIYTIFRDFLDNSEALSKNYMIVPQ